MDLRVIKKLHTNVCHNAKFGAAGARNFKLAEEKGWDYDEAAKKYGIKENTITEKDISGLWIEQKGLCYYTGAPLDGSKIFISHHPLAPSIDRLDSSNGYHNGNIAICLRFINLGKGQASEKLWKETWEFIINFRFLDFLIIFSERHAE